MKKATRWTKQKIVCPAFWRLVIPSGRVSFAGKVNSSYFQSSLKIRLLNVETRLPFLYWGKNSSNQFEGIGNFSKTAKDIRYGSNVPVSYKVPAVHMSKLQRIQNSAVRLVCSTPRLIILHSSYFLCIGYLLPTVSSLKS